MEIQNRTPLTPSNPVGYGIASFLNSFANGISNKSKDTEKERQKEAYLRYLEDKLNANKPKTQAEIDLMNAKGRYYDKGGARGATAKVSSADKYFMQNFTKARDTFLTKYAQPYRHPNMLTNMDLAQKLQGMSDEDRQKQAEIDFAKDDPTGHDLISNPENISHYKSLISPVGTGAPAPGVAPPPANNPMIPKGSPLSMAPAPAAPTAMPPIQTAAMSMPPTDETTQPPEMTDENPEA